MLHNARAGIFWDPREPQPPGFPASHQSPQVAAHFVHLPKQTPVKDKNTLPSDTQHVLPPLSVSLVAQVVHDTANVSVTQSFRNDTNHNISKGTYTFPLPAGCTVTEFSCRVGKNRTVKGKVKPKQEAREEFNIAASRKQIATLLEQDTPEIFTATLANIPANTKLKAEITFITFLKHRDLNGKVTTTLTIPTYIAPRYDTPQELRHTQSNEKVQNLSIRVGVLASEIIESVSSGTHSVTVQNGADISECQSWREFVAGGTTNDPKRALVRLSDGSSFLQQDFVLDITTLPASGEEPMACMEVHPLLADHNAVMLTIPPKSMLPNLPPTYDSEIIFVADRSGSMSDKMEALKSAMRFFLKGLPDSRTFNIWCFGSTYTSLWERSKRLSENTLEEALSYVSQDFRSDMGGTELLEVLKAIVAARAGVHMTDIVMLTDGEVWRQDETIDFVEQTKQMTKGGVRFFALGIGHAVSHDLVEGIAKAGGGYAEVIAQANQGGWEDRMVAVLRAALTGHVGPLRVEFDGEQNPNARAQSVEEDSHTQESIPRSTTYRSPGIPMSPADISKLNPFLHNRLFFFIETKSSLSSIKGFNIRATTPSGEDVIRRVDIKTLNDKATTLHKLGARAFLEDLERGRSWIHLKSQASPWRFYDNNRELIRHEGENIGTKWSLLSKWTSFYAIEELFEIQDTDELVDLDEPQVDRIEASDLDLLRPRGPISEHHYNTIAVFSRADGIQVEEQDSDPESEPDYYARPRSDLIYSGNCMMSRLPPMFLRPPPMFPRPRLRGFPGKMARGAWSSKVSPRQELAKSDDTFSSTACGTSSAPEYQAEALAAIMSPRITLPKSSEDLERESLIRQLLSFQSFDGSFSLSEKDIGIEFGIKFRVVIDQLENYLFKHASHQDSQRHSNQHKLAVTIATIIVLEEKFQSCRDLWILMREKAMGFADRTLLGIDKIDVFQFAKEQFKVMTEKGREGAPMPPREVLNFAPLED